MSFIKRSWFMPEHCGFCHSAKIARIEMTLGDGSVVIMTSCNRCESRAYADDHGAIALEEFLLRAKRTPPAHQQPAPPRTRQHPTHPEPVLQPNWRATPNHPAYGHRREPLQG